MRATPYITGALLCCLGSVGYTQVDERAVSADLACGPSALTTSASLLDRSIVLAQVSLAFEHRVKGEHTLAEIQQAAHGLGFATVIVHHDLADLRIPRLPLIIAINESPGHSHFVVLYGQSEEHIQLLDAPRKPLQIELAQLKGAWDGLGMYVAADEASLQEAGLVPKWKSGLLAAAAGVFVLGIYLTAATVRQRGKHG